MPKIANVTSGKSGNGIIYLLLVTQFVIPFASIALFRERFAYPFRTIYYHMVILGAANTALLVGALLICGITSGLIRTLGEYILSLLLGCFSVLVYAIHLLAWGGNLAIGSYITVDSLIPFLTHLRSTVATLPAPSLAVWGILVVPPTAILIFYATLSPSLFIFLRQSSAGLGEEKQRLIAKFKQPGFVAIATALILGVGYTNYKWPIVNGLTGGEPITRVLFNFDDNSVAFLPISRSGFEDDVVRRNYVRPGHFERKNVILILVDALRPDHLGFMGYSRNTTPFLDTLYREGNLQVVQSSFAAAPWSFGGILSILRAKHLFNMAKRSFAIQDVFKDAGYRVHFVLSADHTYFCRLKSFYGDSIDSFYDGTSPRSFGPNDDRGIFEALDRIQDFDGVPSFFYFHLMSVHYLGPRLPPNIRFSPASPRAGDQERYVNNYDNGLVQEDGFIQELFARLTQKGYLQNSNVVISADHGESLGERNCFTHGKNLYNEELSIPIMIYDPERTVYRNLKIGRQIDIAPTILDRLGLPVPSSWDGHSLLSGEPGEYSHHQLGDCYAVIDYTTSRTLKYICNAHSKKEEVYDLTKDPGETHNLFPTMDAHEIGELRKAISAFPMHPAG